VPLDLSYTLFWVSLSVSAAAVVVFLWLMRTPREASGVKLEASPGEPDTSKKPRLTPDA
jgi:hypothetical protein